MKHPNFTTILLAAFITPTGACATQPIAPTIGDPTLSTYNRPDDEGYRIRLLSAQPAPGTQLRAGSTITFTIRAQYEMTIASTGHATLVFQRGRELVPGTIPQTTKEVSGRSGVVELMRTVTIPPGGGQLALSVPLKPDGLSRTDGEIVITYPIADDGQ